MPFVLILQGLTFALALPDTLEMDTAAKITTSAMEREVGIIVMSMPFAATFLDPFLAPVLPGLRVMA